MMLRASAKELNVPLNPAGITDPKVDPGVVGADGLGQLVYAVILGTEDDRRSARTRVLTELGHDALVDACGVIATFEMMNRVAEGTGMPVSTRALSTSEEWRSQLGI